jgi:hypothetical protein
MAQYVWNPNDQPVNINPVGNGWTMQCRTYTYSSVIELETPVGKRAWRYGVRGGGTENSGYRVTMFDGYSGGAEDQEVLMLCRRDNFRSEMGAGFRIATSGAGNSYFTGFRNNTTDIRWRSVDDCAWGTGVEVDHGVTAENNWWWLRARVTGATAFFVKFWNLGDPEPIAWNIASTGLSLSYSAGGVGVSGFEHQGFNQDTDVAWWSAGTGGDPAPLPWEDSDFHKPSRTPFFLYGIPDTDILFPPTNLNFSNIQQNSMRLNWTAPS